MPYIPLLRAVEDEDEIVLPKRVPEMIRVPAAGLTGVCLSKSLFRMPTHWDGQRTVLCPAPKPCGLCETSAPKEYFLLGFWDNNENAAVWVQLTPPASRALLRDLKGLNRPLHGTVVKIGRARKKGNAPVVVQIDQWATAASKLPTMTDPQETLQRVFGSLDLTRNLLDAPVE